MIVMMIENKDGKADYIRLEFFSHSEGEDAKSMWD